MQCICLPRSDVHDNGMCLNCSKAYSRSDLKLPQNLDLQTQCERSTVLPQLKFGKTPSLIDVKGLKALRLMKRVKFTKATVSHVSIREEKKSIAGENFILPILVSVVHTQQNSRIDLRKKRRDKSDALVEMGGD